MKRKGRLLVRGFILVAVLLGAVGVPRCEAVVTEFDLTTTPASPIEISGAFWDTEAMHSAGTGVFSPFLRIQGDEAKEGYDGVERGYNTGGTLEFETKGGIWTHPLALSSLLNVDGFYQFVLDADQNASTGNFLSIDQLIISQEASPDLTGWPGSFGYPGTVVYDLDGDGDCYVKIDYLLNSEGIGTADVIVEIPVSFFDQAGGSWVYMYCRMGDEFAATDGPENWKALIGGTPPIPAPGAVLLASMGLGLVGWLRQRKAL